MSPGRNESGNAMKSASMSPTAAPNAPPMRSPADAARIRSTTMAAGTTVTYGAPRILRGQRKHMLRSRGPWYLQYYPPLVWVPFLFAYFFPLPFDLPMAVRLVGLAIAIVSAVFAAWAMWSLGKSYGIRMDLFQGHRLVTGGPYRFTRHPMYLGIVSFHVGAMLAMESLALFVITLVYVIPFTALRIRAEDAVLAAGFGDEFQAFAGRVPALVPFAR